MPVARQTVPIRGDCCSWKTKGWLVTPLAETTAVVFPYGNAAGTVSPIAFAVQGGVVAIVVPLKVTVPELPKLEPCMVRAPP